jgi:hypothetical protein
MQHDLGHGYKQDINTDKDTDMDTNVGYIHETWTLDTNMGHRHWTQAWDQSCASGSGWIQNYLQVRIGIWIRIRI